MPVSLSALVYVPGRKIVCTAEEIALQFHTKGWCAPERDRIWIDGVEGELSFMVRRPSASYVFTAEVTPFAAKQARSLEIFFNYFRIEYFEISRASEIKVRLPAELFVLRTSVMRLHCRNAVVGTSVGLDDGRRLGIALHSWMLA